MSFFNFKKSNKEPDTSKTSTKAKKTKRKHVGFKRKKKGDYIASMSLGPVAEQGFIDALDDFLQDDKQEYIKIDGTNHAIYLLALTNDLIKDTSLVDDLGDLYSAIVGSDSRGDMPGTIYNASFDCDLDPETVYSEDETPPQKQVVFLPTLNTLNELEHIADPEQKYEVVRLPSGINADNVDELIKERQINQPLLRPDKSGKLRLVTLAEFKQFVKDQTAVKADVAYDDPEDETEDHKTEDENNVENDESGLTPKDTETYDKSNDTSDNVNLDDETADDPFGEDDPDPLTDSDPFADDSDDDDPFGDQDDDFTDDPFNDDETNNANDDLDDEPVTDNGKEDTSETDDNVADNIPDDPFADDADDNEVDDELNINRPVAKKETPSAKTADQAQPEKSKPANNTQDDLSELNDIDLAKNDFNLDDTDDDDDFTDVADSDEGAVRTDETSLKQAQTAQDQQSDDSEPIAPVTDNAAPEPTAPKAEPTNAPVNDNSSAADNQQPAAVNESVNSAPVTENSSAVNSTPVNAQTANASAQTAPVTPTDNALNQRNDTITISTDQDDVPTAKELPNSENTIYLDTDDPEPGLAQLDPNMKKTSQLTSQNKQVAEDWLKEYGKQIDEWLGHNLKIPVLHTKNRAQYGKQYIAKEVSDNEMLKEEVLNYREQIKNKILEQINSIVANFTDPAKYAENYKASASELRNMFLNEETMKQETVKWINDIMQKSEQERQDMIKKAQEDAELEYENKYKPERDKEITKAESTVKKQHEKQYGLAVDAALSVIQKNAKPKLDEKVKQLLIDSQPLIDEAGLTITADAKTYQKALREKKLVSVNLAADNANNEPIRPSATTITPEQDAEEYDNKMQRQEYQRQMAELQSKLDEMQAKNKDLQSLVDRKSDQINQMETEKIQYRQDALQQHQEAVKSQHLVEQHEQDAAQVRELKDEIKNLKVHTDINNLNLDSDEHLAHHKQDMSDEELFANMTPAPVDDQPATPVRNSSPKSAPAQAPQL